MSGENSIVHARSYRNLSDYHDYIDSIQSASSEIDTNRNTINLDLGQLPDLLVNHIKNDFNDFSEEWVEINKLGKTIKTQRSVNKVYVIKKIESEVFEYENLLVSCYFHNPNGEEVMINDTRYEVIITDGEVDKKETQTSQNHDDYTTFRKQKVIVTQPTIVVVLKRQRQKNEKKILEHTDTIEIHLRGENIINTIKNYLESFLGEKRDKLLIFE